MCCHHLPLWSPADWDTVLLPSQSWNARLAKLSPVAGNLWKKKKEKVTFFFCVSSACLLLFHNWLEAFVIANQQSLAERRTGGNVQVQELLSNSCYKFLPPHVLDDEEQTHFFTVSPVPRQKRQPCRTRYTKKKAHYSVPHRKRESRESTTNTTEILLQFKLRHKPLSINIPPAARSHQTPDNISRAQQCTTTSRQKHNFQCHDTNMDIWRDPETHCMVRLIILISK